MSRPGQPSQGGTAAPRARPGRSDARRAPSAAGSRPGAPLGARAGVGEEAEEEGEAPPAPWHFKLLLFATAGYLVYRLIWFIFWLTGHAWHG